MATKCVLCGAPIAQGIVCSKCDPPRKREQKPASAGQTLGGSAAPAVDPFPKAPVLPFPVEATSVAATSISEILAAARVPAILLSPDGSIRFVSEEAKALPGLGGSLSSLAALEGAMGMRMPDLRKHYAASIRISKRLFDLSLIPLSGGTGGAVLIFRPHPSEALHTAYIAYLREAVLTPLRALREAIVAAGRNRGTDPLLQDAASTIDQILSSLELSPVVTDDRPAPAAPAATPGLPLSGRPTHPVLPILKKLNARFAPLAQLKGITLQIDAPSSDPLFDDMDALESSLTTLLENALHYTPTDGQIVMGMRALDHKGRPLLLFFSMDTGPVVPENLRELIFTDEFSWNARDPQRTGHGLAKIRRFATAHGGQAWVESKTGKTCTFFIRVRPA